MRAQAVDADAALDEGIKFKWLSTIKDIGQGDITVEEMRLDADGKPQPTGQTETLSADSVVLALGQETDSRFLSHIPGLTFADSGVVVVDTDMMTGRPGLFAGGDMTPGDRTVTTAVGHGKKAARNIDRWLRQSPARAESRHPLVAFDQLHLPIYAAAPLAVQTQLSVAARLVRGFAEITAGLSEAEARHEAKRCLSCGNCFECDQCYAACPEQAIIKLGPGKRYEIDLDLCTGCGVCFEQCPCHAIDMVPEPPVATIRTAQ